GLVARVYGGNIVGGLDDRASWDAARRTGAQFLATDDVNAAIDPWAQTPPLAETSSALTVRVEPGDPAGALEGGWVAYDVEPPPAVGAETAWSAWISVPSSRVDDAAKGCIVARSGERSSAPFFAVCRPGDNGG